MIDRNELEMWSNGFTKDLGIHVESIDEKQSVCTLEITDRFMNSYNTVHGGVIYSLLDVTAGALVNWSTGKRTKAVTLSSSVSYLRAFSEGTMRAVATMNKSGKTVANVSVEAYDSEGKLCMTGLFDFFYLDR